MKTNNSTARMAGVASVRRLSAWLPRASVLSVLALLAAFAFCAPVAHADDIDYVYDESGRLVQATNRTSGEAVRYTYDAAGNITSQISGPITTLAIGHFSPRRGPAGTQVTINGTGFSATPANNTVRFNSVPASVVSATQSKIVAVVPAAATSGPISVEVAAATVTSTEAFVVTALGDGPSIAVVLPAVTYSGNIVTIVGANFDPVPIQNRVRFNNATAEVLAATETTLTVRVPADAGSGKISVATPRGIAVSPTDFIVLHPGTPPAALATIDRIMPDGAGSTVNIVNHNTYGLRLFDGKVGDLLSIGFSGMTFPGASIRIHAPDNTVIAQPSVTPAVPGIQLPKLTVAGTYAIYVFPSNLGSATVNVYRPSTTSLSLATPTPVTIAPPGRRALLTFSVPADTYADVTLSGVTVSSGTLTLTAPGGAIVKSQAFTNTGLSFQPLLKQAGQYTLLLDPAGSIGGAATVTVNTSATPMLGTGLFGSRTLSMNSATPAIVTFRAEPNEYPSILTQITSGSSFGLNLVVRAPDGTVFAQRSIGTSYLSNGSQIGSGVLNFGPTAMGGTYTATVQRTSGSSASMMLTLTKANVMPAALPFGTEMSATVDSGQALLTSFNGSIGQFVSLAVTERDGSKRGATAVVLKPDGTALMSQTFTIPAGAGSLPYLPGGGGGGGGPFRDGTAVVNIGPLPMSGTYRVLLQQSDHARELDSYSGPWFLTLTSPIVKALDINGALDHTRFEINGQGVLYRFTGAAGQFLALGMRTDVSHPSNPNTMDAMAVSAFDPEGNQVAAGGMVVTTNSFGSGVVNIGPLPVSGVYSIFMQQLGYWRESTGGIEAYLSRPMTGSMPMETERMGQGAMVTFTASSGDHRAVRVATSGNIASSRLRIFAPDGSQVGTTTNLTQESEHIGYVLVNVGPLTVPGTYVAVAEQTGARSPNIGTFDISVKSPVTGTLIGNANIGVPLDPGQPLQYTFAAAQGSYRSLVVSQSNGPISSASISILDPAGVSLLSDVFSAGGSPLYSGRKVVNVGPLPVAGNYSVLIKQISRNRLSPQVDAGLGLTLAAPMESNASTIDVGIQGQAALRTFTATAGQVVSMTVSENDSSISNTGIKLLAPNGTVLRTGVMNAVRCPGCVGYSGSATVAGAQIPANGTYGVLVQQTVLANDASGTGVLSIGVSGATPAAGNTSSIATTTPGQYATTTYTVSAGESFSVALSSAAMAPASATSYSLFVLRPDGSTHGSIGCSTANPGCELPIRNVTTSGTYQVQVHPASNATISGVLTVAPAVTGELTLDVPVPVSLSAMGQTGLLSFATSVKQTLSLSLDSVTSAPANATLYVTVSNSAGASVGELTIPGGATINLPELAPDAYFVWIRPQYPATANMQLTLRSMVGGAAPVDGAAINFNGLSIGQAAYYTFEAQAGESIGLALSNVVVTPATTDSLARAYVYAPGSVSALGSALCQTSRCAVALRNLAKSGTYRVVITPYLATRAVAGTLTVSRAVTGTLTPNQSVALNLTALGQPAHFSFTAIAGQHFSLNIGGLTATPAGTTLNATVYDSQGNAKAAGTVSAGLSLELPNLPPDNYVVWLTQVLPMTASVQVTLRSMPMLLTDGTSSSFDTVALGQTSYFTFEAQAGESIGLALSNVVVTPATTDYLARAYVYAPGSTSALDSALCQTSRCAVALRNLAKSGTYRVVVMPYLATRTAAGTVTVSKAVTGTLTPNQSLALNLAAPGQPAHFSFTATAGQHSSLNIGGLTATPAGSIVNATVYDSHGNVEATGPTSNGLTLELPALPADTYFVWITQQLPMTASMQVALRSVTMPPTDGASVNFDTATIGQTSYYTFNAQAGESVGLALTSLVATPAATGQVLTVRVYVPGSPFAFSTSTCSTPGCVVSLRSLAQSGTYRVALTPVQVGATVAGSLTVTKAVTGALTPDQPVTLNLGALGQPAQYSFTAAAGQNFSVNVGGLSATPAGTVIGVSVFNAAGANIANGTTTNGLSFEAQNLAAGNYFVWITQSMPMTGSMQVRLGSMPLLTTDGASVNFDTATIGQTSYYTFNAQAGESVGLALTNLVATPAATGQVLTVRVYVPGNPFAFSSSTCSTPGCVISLRSLAQSGTYRVALTPVQVGATVAGSLTVTKAVMGTLTPDQPVSLNLGALGQPAQYSFTAAAGQNFSVNVGSLSATPASTVIGMSLFNAAGANIANGTTTNGLSFEAQNLAAGNYFVWITQSMPMTGSMQVRLGSMPLLTSDGASVNFDTATIGQTSYYTFNAQAGESVGLALTNLVATPAAPGQVATIRVYAPGNPFAFSTSTCLALGCAVSLRSLTQGGTHRVALTPVQAGATVAGTIAVSSAVTTSLNPGTPLTLNLTQPGQPAVLSFSRAAAQPLSLNITSITTVPAGTSYSAVLYNSAGGAVASGTSASTIALTAASLPAGSYTVWIYASTTSAPSTATMIVSF